MDRMMFFKKLSTPFKVCLIIVVEIVESKFLPVLNSFGLKSCATDLGDLQHVYSYDSLLKCLSACTSMNDVIGCNYQRDTRVCQMFRSRGSVAIKHDASEISSRYINCYKDDQTIRDLVYRTYSFLMTPSFCSDNCRNYGKTIAGVQPARSSWLCCGWAHVWEQQTRKSSERFKNECYCSDSYGLYGVGTGCNSPCDGNPNEICGGANFNSVYTVCDKGMYGLKCDLRCSCGAQCVCHRFTGVAI
ncbi:hypothetical protein HELRODRAFT_179324 [Helobdella robusta]|uniref:WSC domain-containing protein n=1 Tax=Helobdella robusta TaxID=6412 RepID=T1FEJ7_HELRO|nr:hypothetical protein HELRODRAFT_179324 [Helobdella robusta]ESN95548.1 hypothetical protein HELRODRAFT_179324 [Helobdella robusta]